MVYCVYRVRERPEPTLTAADYAAESEDIMSENKKTATAITNELREATFAEIVTMLAPLDGVQTEATSITFPLVDGNGNERYGTVKLTVHKEDFDFEEVTAAWDAKLAERAEKAKKKEAEAAKKAKARAEKEAKAKKNAPEGGEGAGE